MDTVECLHHGDVASVAIQYSYLNSPLSLLFHGQALNITGVSNAGSFCIGYTGCRDTLPSLQKIAVYSGEALDELESAVGL